MLTPAGFVLLRAPRLPVEDFRRVCEGQLEAIVARPEVREAIALASPSLAERMNNDDAIDALTRYVKRMTTRATPFGLFAGVTMGDVGRGADRKETTIELGKCIRRARPDVRALMMMMMMMDGGEHEPDEVRAAPWITERAGRLHLIERHGATFRTIAIPKESAFGKILEGAKNGFVKVANLDSSRSHVAQLLKAGFLITKNMPPRLTRMKKEDEHAPEQQVVVDMQREGRVTIGKSEIDLIARGVRALHRLSRASLKENSSSFDALATFLGNREVPLMDAVDAYTPTTTTKPCAEEKQIHGLLLSKLEVAWRTNAQEIAITERELETLKVPELPLARSVAAFATLLGGGRAVLHGFGGASAARTLARFAIWDSALADALTKHLAVAEEDPHRETTIYAEVVHIPADVKEANVCVRPALRAYEIPICANAGVADDHTITLDDLLVSASAQGFIRLRSKRLNKWIVPRLSCAHAFTAGHHPVYEFLCALQTQGVCASGDFDWGAFDKRARFLPRVVFENRLILSPRRFRVTSASELELAQLPRYVGLVTNIDHVLPIDLESASSKRFLVDALRGGGNNKEAELVELFLDDKDLIARDEDGFHYTHEVVVPFVNSEGEQPLPPPPWTTTKLQRSFTPGSEWLYAKIYAPPCAFDDLLRDVVRPWIDGEASAHFVRYADPHPHLRVRFRPRELAQSLAVLHSLASAYRVELGTYEREIERYNGDRGMLQAEEIFAIDTRAALDFLVRGGKPSERGRLFFAWRGTLDLLNAFGRTDFATFFAGAYDEIASVLGPSPETEHAVARRFREERSDIENLLLVTTDDDYDDEILERRRSSLSQRGIADDAYLRSLVHMWNNRVLSFPSLDQELMLNGLAARHYRSQQARRVLRATSQECDDALRSTPSNGRLRGDRHAARSIGAGV